MQSLAKSPDGLARAQLRRQSTAAMAVQATDNRRQSAVGVTLGAKAVEGEQVRPVRRVMTKEKRQVVQGTSADMDMSFTSQQEKGWTFEVGETTSQAEQSEIKSAVATNFLLAHLNEEQQAEFEGFTYIPEAAALSLADAEGGLEEGSGTGDKRKSQYTQPAPRSST